MDVTSVLKVEDSNTLECQFCQISFNENRGLRQHLKLFHDSVELPPCKRSGRKPKTPSNKLRSLYKCSICDKGFFCKSSVSRHCKQFHSGQNKPGESVVEKPYFENNNELGNSFIFYSQNNDFSNVSPDLNISHYQENYHIINQEDLQLTEPYLMFAQNNPSNAIKPAEPSQITDPLLVHLTVLPENTCWKCGKTFTLKKYKDRHLHVVHKIKPSVKQTVECPVCPHLVESRRKLMEHLSATHQVTAELLKLEFEDMDAFREWKDEMERRTTSFYYLSRTRRNKAEKQFFFSCNRSGRYVPKQMAERKRKAKSSGLRKTIHTCPSFIKVVCSEKSAGGVSVAFCGTHVGHTHDSSHLNLSPTVRKSDRHLQSKKNNPPKPIGSLDAEKNVFPGPTLDQRKLHLSEKLMRLVDSCTTNQELDIVDSGFKSVDQALELLRSTFGKLEADQNYMQLGAVLQHQQELIFANVPSLTEHA